MRRLTKRFRNEIGNNIRLDVVARGQGREPVTITMRGPSSTMENNITRMEAQHLHEMLGKIL